MRQATEADDRLEMAHAHRRFHVAVVALAGNRQLAALYESVLVQAPALHGGQPAPGGRGGAARWTACTGTSGCSPRSSRATRRTCWPRWPATAPGPTCPEWRIAPATSRARYKHEPSPETQRSTIDYMQDLRRSHRAASRTRTCTAPGGRRADRPGPDPDRGDDAVWISRVAADALLARAEALAGRDPADCRCPASRSRSRTTSTSPACRPPPACPDFAYLPERTAPVVQPPARRRRACWSARPTSTSSPPG